MNYFPDHPPLKEYKLPGIATVTLGDAANGLCGGMTYVVADLHVAGVVPPPDTAPPSAGERRYESIVDRQIDSFAAGAVPLRFYRLMSPSRPDREPSWAPLAARAGIDRHSRAYVMVQIEWPRIRKQLDGGHLAPIGLVREIGIDPMLLSHNHQVIAYGYDLDGNNLTLAIYDPNCPDDDNVTLKLDVGNPMEAVAAQYSAPGPAVVCFFLTPYSPANPAAWR